MKQNSVLLSELLDKDGYKASETQRDCGRARPLPSKGAYENELGRTVLDSGCCGMAGAFGFEKDHYDVSVKAGERVLLPAVRKADKDTPIIADGFGCREQITQLTDRQCTSFGSGDSVGNAGRSPWLGCSVPGKEIPDGRGEKDLNS